MTVTAQNLVDEVRARTDIQGSTHLTDAEILGYLNEALAEVHERLCQSFEDYAVTTATFTIPASGGLGFTLPSDFYKELRVDRSLSGSTTAADWFRLDRVALRDETNWMQAALQASAYRRVYGYILCGNEIRIVPKAQASGVYQLLYYPAWTDVALTDVVSVGPAGQHWEKLAVFEACIDVANKEEQDPSPFMAQRDRLLKRLDEAAANRSANQQEPPAVLQVPWEDRVSASDLWPGGGWL